MGKLILLIGLIGAVIIGSFITTPPTGLDTRHAILGTLMLALTIIGTLADERKNQ